jgi:hypothetical protein
MGPRTAAIAAQWVGLILPGMIEYRWSRLGWRGRKTQRKLEICAAIFANLCFEKHAITQP